MTERFFYHSFPRRGGEDSLEKGLKILESLGASGLLLTPEKTEWREFLDDGTRSEAFELFQKRACFTELSPSELEGHSKVFGNFAIELSIPDFIGMGGIPVFYLPSSDSEDAGLAGLGAAIIARLGDIQLLLQRLSQVLAVVRDTPDKGEPICATGEITGATRITVGGAEDLLTLLTHRIRPVEELLGALRGIGGFFYPTENFSFTEELSYYRQREWRLIANLARAGQSFSRPLSDEEKDRLLDIDEEFFGRKMNFPTGTYRRVDQCQYYNDGSDRLFLARSRRIYVPEPVEKDAVKILERLNIDTPVVSVPWITSRI